MGTPSLTMKLGMVSLQAPSPQWPLHSASAGVIDLACEVVVGSLTGDWLRREKRGFACDRIATEHSHDAFGVAVSVSGREGLSLQVS